MRFEPISTLPNACPLFVEDAYDALVSKLGVKAWHWGVPLTGSELERFLLYGQSRSNRGDFYDLRRSRDGYSFHDVFDHAICFKGEMGAPFVMTMPYGDGATFQDAFASFTESYYADKDRVAYACDSLGCKSYRTRDWIGQLHASPKFEAVIVPDVFKVRENGDFAAIIAMYSWMRDLSDIGGFKLPNTVVER